MTNPQHEALVECAVCGKLPHQHSGGIPNYCQIIPTYRPKAATTATPSDEEAELRRAAQAMSDFIGKSGMRVYATDLVVRELRAALEPQAGKVG